MTCYFFLEFFHILKSRKSISKYNKHKHNKRTKNQNTEPKLKALLNKYPTTISGKKKNSWLLLVK